MYILYFLTLTGDQLSVNKNLLLLLLHTGRPCGIDLNSSWTEGAFKRSAPMDPRNTPLARSTKRKVPLRFLNKLQASYLRLTALFLLLGAAFRNHQFAQNLYNISSIDCPNMWEVGTKNTKLFNNWNLSVNLEVHTFYCNDGRPFLKPVKLKFDTRFPNMSAISGNV